MTKSAKIIKKILIANRGEIACRVIKTARKMGIATVAVYSDADRKALHVRLADESVHIGPSPAVESYLVIEKIIAAAIETGADAIHPGYGFLSENPDFVRACEKAGLIFIGPSAEAMEAMGLKDAAKKLMDKAGVPITPGYHGKDQSPKLLKAKAGMIGYPVLIKAVAGGGGKGMRKVEADADFDAALASCKREAASSFGNDDVLIEKYIQSPRHIEVQVFGDTHGNVVHMFERDCSLQRRHQKVIEEAPAPGMTDTVRKAMTDAAINAAKAVNYVGAGTVEFIVDGSGKLKKDGFWFMEMNTRLQVEHPVTEMVTGLDLVEWQIRVAQGEKLPKQKDIKMEGHAVEARIYAEDPANDFLPSIGTLKVEDFSGYFHDDKSGVRVDKGIVQGDNNISIYYDPMIAKMIGYGPDRISAIDYLSDGILFSELKGLKTNSGFLSEILKDEVFRAGDVETGFIPKRANQLITPDLSQTNQAFAVAASILAFGQGESSNLAPFVQRDGWNLNLPHKQDWLFNRGDEVIKVTLTHIYRDSWRAHIDGMTLFINRAASDFVIPTSEAFQYLHEWNWTITDSHVVMQYKNDVITVQRYIAHGGELTTSADAITAPMPGKIIALNVVAGDSVTQGDPLIVMEAMKMEQTLTAPRDGTVAEIGAEVGELVTDGALLVRLEEEEEK